MSVACRAPLPCLVALVVAALLASCGGADSSFSPPPTSVAPPSASLPAGTGTAAGPLPDPCGLLTPAEIAAVLGNEVSEGRLAGSQACTWLAEPEARSVSIGLGSVTPDICVVGLQGDQYKLIEGLDFNAYWQFAPAGGGVGSIIACGPEIMTTLTVTAGVDEEADEAGLRSMVDSLIGTALGRL